MLVVAVDQAAAVQATAVRQVQAEHRQVRVAVPEGLAGVVAEEEVVVAAVAEPRQISHAKSRTAQPEGTGTASNASVWTMVVEAGRPLR